MTKKVFLEEGDHQSTLRKQDLHAEHAKDIKPALQAIRHPKNIQPRNPNTHVSIRLRQDVCDWLWEMYPNEPTISAALVRFVKEQYGARAKASTL